MSFVSITGLILGVAVLILVLSIMNGFEEELRRRVLGVMPHGVIYSDRGFDNWQEPAGQMASHESVTGTAPLVEGGGLLVANGEIAGISFSGVDPGREAQVSIIGEFFRKGELADLQSGSFRLVLGAALASDLQVSIGDKVTLVLPDAQLTLAGPLPRMKRFEVAGIFEVGAAAGRSLLLMPLDDALTQDSIRGVEG
ncbi:MAG: ABC transporter permease, partial [Pseudomonadales bacterium]|nr:ABC transporter permease [Pseudomonadales bacterium]